MIHPQVHLRIPCYDFSFLQIIRFKCVCSKDKSFKLSHFHRIIQSVGATGGVYKGQGRNQHQLFTRAYQEFHVQDQQFQCSIPTMTETQMIPQPSQVRTFKKENDSIILKGCPLKTKESSFYRTCSLIPSLQRACGPEHRRASQTCYCLKLPSARNKIIANSPFKKCLAQMNEKRVDIPEGMLPLLHLLIKQRSRSLSELTRQFTPPTKNDHAPPPSKSRKSSQSVNPPAIWPW